jgi:nicotinamidase-related amidase
VIQECQEGVIGASSVLPELAAEAHRVAVPNIARLVRSARAAGVPVVHCLAVRHPNGLGASDNAPLYRALTRRGIRIEAGTPGAQVVDEIGVEPSDLTLLRYHGLGPMGGTELDHVLRAMGVSTVVATGVSVNVAITSLTLDAVNAGYEVVLPRDAVAGVPAEWAEAMIDNMLSLLSTLTTTEEVLAWWHEAAAGTP